MKGLLSLLLYTMQGTYPLQGMYPTSVYLELELTCCGNGLKVEMLESSLGSIMVTLTTTTVTVSRRMISSPTTMAMSSCVQIRMNFNFPFYFCIFIPFFEQLSSSKFFGLPNPSWTGVLLMSYPHKNNKF